MQSPEKAEELGCSGGDYKCICKQGTVEKFIAGFRDCAAQACPGAYSKSLIDVATNLCRGETRQPLLACPTTTDEDLQVPVLW